MILERFYDEKLAQASWLVGCATTGEALIVDANRDVAQYLASAQAEGLRITHVAETHIHADFVSGSRELVAATGARLLLSGEGDADWHYGFLGSDGATALNDGDRFHVGNIEVEVVHTPGHTPEHLSFLITDRAGANRPMGIFTGDFVFVGDVGRPDLLEKAAGHAGTAATAARALFRSLDWFRALPDYVQVWPGHGAGSACGKALGAVPQSTVGYEKLFNPALAISDEARFIDWVLEDQPEPPKYFAEMKRINREGPRVLNGFATPPRRDLAALERALGAGGLVVDTRSASAFRQAHIPGTINIPLNRAFTTWAGWLLPYDAEVYLVVDEREHAGALSEVVRDLAMIGLDRVAGWVSASVLQEWAARHGALESAAEVDTGRLARAVAGDAVIIDVRDRSEWAAGHIPGVLHIPLGELPDRADEIPRDRPIAVHCQSGSRAAIAQSLLLARRFEDVRNVRGGFSAWQGEGRPVERGEPQRA
ncbi:MAG: MBL fold metallo-hydrolase [Longimicrobiales bacterium]